MADPGVVAESAIMRRGPKFVGIAVGTAVVQGMECDTFSVG
jgi:hypothetical protein